MKLRAASRSAGSLKLTSRSGASPRKESTGRKGKALFLPLRQALTGQDHGPEMGALLPVLGEEVARRLERAASA